MDVSVLVVPAGGAGIGIVESLNEPGPFDITVYAADADPLAGALYAGMAKPLQIPYMATRDDFVGAIHDIVARYGIDVLIAANEEEACILSEETDRLKAEGCVFLTPEPNTIRAAANKRKAAAAAQGLGIAVPYTVHLQEDSDPFALDLTYPVVLKPASGSGGGARDILFADTLDELVFNYASISSLYGDLMIQEMIVGGPGSIHMVPLLYDAAGELIASYCSRSLKTIFSWGGYAVVGESVENPSLVQKAVELIAAFGRWSGPVSVEFKVDDRTGEPALLEINTRINGYNYLVSCPGNRFTYLFYF